MWILVIILNIGQFLSHENNSHKQWVEPEVKATHTLRCDEAERDSIKELQAERLIGCVVARGSGGDFFTQVQKAVLIASEY